MQETRPKQKAALLVSSLLLLGLAVRAHAVSSDINEGSSIGSDAHVTVSTENALIPGSLNTSAPSPQETQDTLTATFGLPNVLLDTEFNIFNVSPAQITEWGTVYGEVWSGVNTQWGGATVGLPVGRLGVFLGRPYAGTAGSIGQTIGTAPTGKADASANPILTGVQNGAAGSWLGTLTSDPAGVLGHALYDNRTLAPRNLFDLFYGIPLGDNLSLGLAYAYATNKDEESWNENRPTALTANTANDGSISNDRKTTDHQISIGALVKNLGPVEKLDVALNFSKASVDNKHAETRLNANGTTAASANSTFESDGAGTIGFLLRSMAKLGETGKLVTAFNYNRPNASSKGTFKVDTDGNGTLNNLAADIDRSWTLDDKTTNFRFDAAYHTMPTDALKVIYALSYVRSKSTREFMTSINNNHVGNGFGGLTGVTDKETREETASGLPLGIAVEHQTWSKIATRFGVRKTLFGKNKVEITDTTNRGAVGGAIVVDQTAFRKTEIDSSVAATATLGLGIKPTKDVDIDLGLVTNLFDLDTGAGVSDVITRASVRYHF